MSWSCSNRAPGSIRFGLVNMALVPLILLGIAAASRAQGMGADPFRPYNSQYDAFIFPIAPGPMDAGFRAARDTQGVRGANQFENYMNSLQGTGSHAGAGTPYYRANRAYDREFNRDYRPNREADARFDTNQEMVTELYFKALREKDPQKRAEIFKDYSRARSRADRDLASPRTPTRKSTTGTTRRGGAPALGSDSTGSGNKNRARQRTVGTGYGRASFPDPGRRVDGSVVDRTGPVASGWTPARARHFVARTQPLAGSRTCHQPRAIAGEPAETRCGDPASHAYSLSVPRSLRPGCGKPRRVFTGEAVATNGRGRPLER